MAFQPIRDGSTNAKRFASVRFFKEDPKETLELADSVFLEILRLNTERKSLERWQKSLGTQKDSQELRKNMRSTGTIINEIAKRTLQDLQKLNNLARGSNKSMKLRASYLKNEFKEALLLCNEAHKLSLSTLETTCLPTEVAFMVSNPTSGGSPSPHAEEFVCQATNSLESQTGLLQEKQQLIASIKKDITDLIHIMAEIENLAHNKAAHLSSVGSSAGNGQQDSERVQLELQTAGSHQTWLRKRRCPLLSLCALLLVGCSVAAIITFYLIQ